MLVYLSESFPYTNKYLSKTDKVPPLISVQLTFWSCQLFQVYLTSPAFRSFQLSSASSFQLPVLPAFHCSSIHAAPAFRSFQLFRASSFQVVRSFQYSFHAVPAFRSPQSFWLPGCSVYSNYSSSIHSSIITGCSNNLQHLFFTCSMLINFAGPR